jgi:hypothetical protein
MSQANESLSTLLGQTEYAKSVPELSGQRGPLLSRARAVCLARGARWYKQHVGTQGLSECSTVFLRDLLARKG